MCMCVLYVADFEMGALLKVTVGGSGGRTLKVLISFGRRRGGGGYGWLPFTSLSKGRMVLRLM